MCVCTRFCWHQEVEATDGAKHPALSRVAPRTESSLAPHASSPKAEKAGIGLEQGLGAPTLHFLTKPLMVVGPGLDAGTLRWSGVNLWCSVNPWSWSLTDRHPSASSAPEQGTEKSKQEAPSLGLGREIREAEEGARRLALTGWGNWAAVSALGLSFLLWPVLG